VFFFFFFQKKEFFFFFFIQKKVGNFFFGEKKNLKFQKIHFPLKYFSLLWLFPFIFFFTDKEVILFICNLQKSVQFTLWVQ